MDSDNDDGYGIPECDQDEDGAEEDAPGKILRQNIDDDNTNGVADRMEAPLQDAAGQPVDDDDLCPAILSWGPTGTAMTGCVLELSRTANLRLWETRDKQTPAMSYTIGTDEVPSEIYVEGYDLGQGTVTATLKDPSGVTLDSDVVMLTVVNLDLDVRTIYRNLPAGTLEDVYEESPGAWVPYNDDDDDYDSGNTPDYQQAGAIPGENDLLPIVLRAVQPASVGGTYTLDFGGGIRIWENSDRTGEVDSGVTALDATVETILYVEGIAPGSAVPIRLDWENGGCGIQDADRIVVKVFRWEGPLNVPGYSIYKYRATGGMAGAGNSMWIAPLDGTLQASSQGDSVDEADILWDGGPVVGMALYQAQAYYIWGLDVNVVEIRLGSPNNGVAQPDQGAPCQLGGAGSAIIAASDKRRAMSAEITVELVRGPTVGGGERGKKFMELGLSHQAMLSGMHALYNDSTPPQRVRCSLQDSLIHWDVASEGNIPWIDRDDDDYLDIVSDTQVVQNHTFSTEDNPAFPTTNQFVLNFDKADELVSWMQHWVPLIVRSKDARVIDAQEVRTQRAMLTWRFDGTGSVDALGVWTLDAAGVTVDPSFAEIQDGRRFFDAARNLNEAYQAGVTWFVEDQ